jgi:release factor glutamine methyltransferase
VLIAILKNVHGATGSGYDISKQAIIVAKENAKRNEVAAIFERSNFFEDVPDEKVDVIVANPPYIPTGEIAGLMPEVAEFEPHLALDGGEDGLDCYRRIVAQSVDYLNPGGYLLLEIGCSQGEAVSALLREAGYVDVCVIKDLARNDRVVKGRFDY